MLYNNVVILTQYIVLYFLQQVRRMEAMLLYNIVILALFIVQYR